MVRSMLFCVANQSGEINALPESLGASNTVHDRFQEWRKAGVFRRI